MKFPKRLLLLGVAALLASHPARAQDSSPTPPGASPSPTPEKKEKQKVTLLDGSTLFGKIEMTDDYTLRVSSDSALMKIPVALLGEKDFKKYTSQKDRSSDGRLWSERKDALEDADKKEDAKDGDKDKDKTASKEDNVFEIQLQQIAIFQPAIDSYEKLLSDKKSQKSDAKDGDKDKDKTAKSDPPFIPLFSQPAGGQLPGPLGAIGGYVEPVTSLGATAVDATAGAGVGLPTVP